MLAWILGVLLLVIALLLRRGKLLFLLAGYNTMSPREKARIDPVKMGKRASLFVFGGAAICFLKALNL